MTQHPANTPITTDSLPSHACGRGRLKRDVWGSKDDCRGCQSEAARIRGMRQQLGITPISVADSTITFDDSTSAPLVRGVIPAGVKLTALTHTLLCIAVGVAFTLPWLIRPEEILDVSLRFWGLK